VRVIGYGPLPHMKSTTSSLVVGLLVGAIGASAVFALVGRRPSGESISAARVLRVAHSLPTSHPVHLGIEHMARRAAELSRGRLRLDVFPAEQLGNETQCLEQTQAGTLAITKVSAGVIGNFVNSYRVFSLPYLFRDAGHMWAVLEGDIGRSLLDMLSVGNDGRPSGLTGLGFYDSGSRNFYSKTAILSPADLRGRKVRVMADAVAMDAVQAMGAAATPIPWGELYTSLQQGVVDAAENNPPTLLSSRHYEVGRHFTMSHHMRIPDVVVVSSRVWQSLSPEERAWIQQATDESVAVQRELWAESSDAALEQLRGMGVEVHEVDERPFREAVAPVVAKYSEGVIADLVRQIEAVR
jgi:tripartite ATP-independent transporter DctP family solute receptor